MINPEFWGLVLETTRRPIITIHRRAFDALASPVEMRCTDNSMPWQNWAKYDKPAVFRRLSIDIKRKKLERK